MTLRLAASAVAALAIAVAGADRPQAPSPRDSALESMPFAPRRAICYRTAAPLAIDGALSEPAWQAAPWSDAFVDIVGDARPRPRLGTRMKLLWDANALYVGAELEEPDLWGTIVERDAVLFHENDFEVFIDPDGDTHEYYELEVNVLRTAWDLLLVRPYRDGGPPVNGWDIAGLQVGVDARGTINHPGDRDAGWTVEIAMPWRTLIEAAPGQRPPRAGEQWRVNFSRVEWTLDPARDGYVRRADPAAPNRLLPEDNWVWSPQGAVAMHMPERWGFVQFSGRTAGSGVDAFVEDPNERVKWALRRLYYRERRYHDAHGRFTADPAALEAADIAVDGLAFRPAIEATTDLYEIRAPGFGGAVVHLRQDGKVWVAR